MPLIFVSYRREDSAAAAGRICDRLQRSYGKKSVFFDIGSIPIADDFTAKISTAVARADALLAIVGPRWAGSGPDGKPRIDETGDFVRREIESALATRVPVIPVLVAGAAMPDPAGIPESLRPFCGHNAARVDDTIDFDQQMRRLVRRIDQILHEKSR